MQLLKLRGIDNPKILQYTDKKMNMYTSHQIQNAIISTLALMISHGT